MNPKFFDVKKEKQDAIINAALMVFAENGYRKASTDVMVKEAGISKGLLFHYFISKQGVYEFVYDYSVKYMMLELMQTVRKDEKDFFSIQRMIELAKTRVMKNYPYMQQFLSNVKYENHPDALKVIKACDKVIDDTYDSIYKRADMSRFRGSVDQQKIIRMIGWMSDGYIKDKFREGTPDLDEMNAEFAQYLSMLRDHFYGNTTLTKPQPIMPPVEAEEIERDDTVMDSIREEMLKKPAKEETTEKPRELSFEERLALGKRSAYAGDQPEEEKAEEKTEEKIEDTAEEKIEDTAEEKIEDTTEEKTEEDTDEAADFKEAEDEEASEASEEEPEEDKDTGEAITEEEAAADDDKETEEDSKDISEADKTEPAKEVTISVDSFSEAYRDYDNYSSLTSDATYAASQTVASYVPSTDLSFYEESRLGDFTYGSDARGGRGIPYDSSENIQIFVSEDDDEPESVTEEDSFDISGLSEKIMNNTDKETAEAERNRELESMGPAPVLPDFRPENIRNNTQGSYDENEGDAHIYRPLKF